jgi:hypothetical protein
MKKHFACHETGYHGNHQKEQDEGKEDTKQEAVNKTEGR